MGLLSYASVYEIHSSFEGDGMYADVVSHDPRFSFQFAPEVIPGGCSVAVKLQLLKVRAVVSICV